MENKDFSFLIENIKIYKNPTKERFINLISTDVNFCIRAIITDEDIYCWKGSLFIHQNVLEYLESIYNIQPQNILANIIFDNDKRVLVYKTSASLNIKEFKEVYVKKYMDSINYQYNTVSIYIAKDLEYVKIQQNNKLNDLINIYEKLK